MKAKKLFLGLTILATTTLLASCSAKKSATEKTNEAPKTEQTTKDDQLDKFIKDKQKLIEVYRFDYYLSGQSVTYEKLQNESLKKNEQIYLNSSDLESRLTKVKVEVGDYDDSTKRITIKVTNGYSEDLLGYESVDSSEENTTIAIAGYLKENTRTDISTISYNEFFSFAPRQDIKSGETVEFKVIVPRFASKKEYINETFDSAYRHMFIPDEGAMVYKNFDEGESGSEAIENYDNLFSIVGMNFKKYPKEASISDKEIVEMYDLMK